MKQHIIDMIIEMEAEVDYYTKSCDNYLIDMAEATQDGERAYNYKRWVENYEQRKLRLEVMDYLKSRLDTLERIEQAHTQQGS